MNWTVVAANHRRTAEGREGEGRGGEGRETKS